MSNEKKSKAGVWAMVAKVGSKIFSFLVKSFKFTKIGLAGISFAGYAALFTWKFALLLMIAVGFHESGHVWAMKRMGIKTKGFYFLPFVGGAAIAEEQYNTYGENAFIAIMGPIWGAALGWACAWAYWSTGNPMWAAAASWMAVLNLFNLLPINPLDGGQLIRSIAFSIHKGLGLAFMAISMVAATYVMWKLKIGLFALLLIVAGAELFFEVKLRINLAKVRNGTMSKWLLPVSVFDSNTEDGLKHYPTSMKWSQLGLAIAAYVVTILSLVALMMITKHVPGADIAANFLE